MSSLLLTALTLLQPAAASERQVGHFDVDTVTDSPLQVELTRTIDAPPEVVFQLVSQDLPLWFAQIPSVDWDLSTSQTDGEIDAGAKRSCGFGDDWLFEDIAYWEDDGDQRVVAYAIDMDKSTLNMPMRDHLGVMMVEASGDGSLLTWRQYYTRPFSPMSLMVNMGISKTMNDGVDELERVAPEQARMRKVSAR